MLGANGLCFVEYLGPEEFPGEEDIVVKGLDAK